MANNSQNGEPGDETIPSFHGTTNNTDQGDDRLHRVTVVSPVGERPKTSSERGTWWEQYSQSDIWLAKTAIHEAGHALMCYASLTQFDYEYGDRETTIDPVKCAPKGCSGYCRCRPGSYSDRGDDGDALYSEDSEALMWEWEGFAPPCSTAWAHLDILVAGAAAVQLFDRNGEMSASDNAHAVAAAKTMGLRGNSARKEIRVRTEAVRTELCQDRFLLPLILIACALLERKTITRCDSTVESIFEFSHQALADRREPIPGPTGAVSTGRETWTPVISVIEQLLYVKLHPGMVGLLRHIAAAVRDSIWRHNEPNKVERFLAHVFGPEFLPERDFEEKQLQALERCEHLPFLVYSESLPISDGN